MKIQQSLLERETEAIELQNQLLEELKEGSGEIMPMKLLISHSQLELLTDLVDLAINEIKDRLSFDDNFSVAANEPVKCAKCGEMYPRQDMDVLVDDSVVCHPCFNETKDNV